MMRQLTLGAMMLGALEGCAAQVQFKDQPIVWEVDDQQPIAEPEEQPFVAIAQGMDWFLARRLNRTLELRDKELAHNINALDEVPDSSWFTNRIGVRTITPEEAAQGASAEGPPIPPIMVVGGKSGGVNPGVLAKDTTGRTFVVKFDTKDNPEMQTSINTMVNRIFWTAGYNVANDTIFEFTPSQISVKPEAELTNELGQKVPITEGMVRDILALVPQWPDGHYRASASQFIKGIPKGGWSTEGVRGDDPNDVVPHEHRREVRGLRTFSAWLNHTDVKEDNTLDAYVEEDGKRFLKHYLIDFGEAMGGHGAEKGRYEDGYENWLDWEIQSKALVAFGFWVRPWEHLQQTRWPSVGAFTAEHFDPAEWREAYPYWPFAETDQNDNYWAAKLILRFDRPLLKAIVKTGQLSHPAAEEYLVDTLLKRRELIGRSYVQPLTALDHFTINQRELCAVDLSVRHRLVTAGMVEILDAGDAVSWDRLVANDGSICIPIPQDEQYRIYRMRTRRRLELTPVMQVHFRGGPNARVLGIVRIEP
jgi:hypothetical protein